MGFLLKGLSSCEMSDYLEMPDMAEMMTYPIFRDAYIDEAYKYGSEWQRKLLDMTSLKGTRKYITVRSEVKFITPSVRSMTHFNTQHHDNAESEWHIDTVEDENANHTGYYQEVTDYVHLFTSKNSCMTEFINMDDIWLEDIDPKNTKIDELTTYVLRNKEKLGLNAVSMPHNRMITFTNHMHRAIDPKCIEFRYMCRIMESNRPYIPSPYSPEATTVIANGDGRFLKNIEQTADQIIIHLPNTVKADPRYRPSRPIHEITTKSQINIAEVDYEMDGKKGLKIILKSDVELTESELEKFKRDCDRGMRVSEAHNYNSHFRTSLRDIELVDGKLVATAYILRADTTHLRNVDYVVTFNYDCPIRLSANNNLIFSYKKASLV